MATIEKSQRPKTKVFISYSRKDMAFADRLVTALETRNIEVKIDRRDLPLLEEWQREIFGFIRQADAAILIVSPNSISSQWIKWEVQCISELNKRLAPVVLEPVPAEHIPDSIKKINFVFFNPPNDFDERANALVAALNTNIAWVKEHTRIGELAGRWAERGRSAHDVLRGNQIKEAESWITQAPANSPQPTALHSEFIQASRHAETRRRRMTVGTFGLALAVTIALGVTALLLKRQSDRKRDAALIEQSRFLTDQARQSLKAKDYATALSLALEGLPNDPEMTERPFFPEALTALQHAAYNVLETHVVSIEAILPHYGTHWIDPDSISSTFADEKSGPTASASSMPENVWMLTAGPLWPWELITAARQEKRGKPGNTESSATGGRVVQGRGNHRVQILDIATRKILADLEGHEGNAYGAALSPDGRRLATLGQGRVRAKLWDTAKSSLVADLEGFNGGIWNIAFSGNGAKIITADGQGKTARIFDGKVGRLLTTLGPVDEVVTFAALSRDGSMAITVSPEGTIRLWRVNDATQLRLLSNHTKIMNGGTFSPDGSLIALYFQDGTVQVHPTRENRGPIALRHESQVNDAEFSRDGTKLVTASDDHTAIVWDVRRGEALVILAGHAEPVKQACFAPDGAKVITLGDKTVREWQMVSPLAPILRGESPEVNTATFSPDGSKIITASEEGEVLAWNARTGKKNAVLEGHSWGVDTVVFSDDGTKVLTGGRDGKTRLWHNDGRLIHEFKEDSGASFKAVALSGDGTTVAATSVRSNVIVVWNSGTFKELQRIPDPRGAATQSLAFSKDSKHLFAGYLRGEIKQWDVSTGKPIPEIEGVPEILAVEEASSHDDHFVRIDPARSSRAELRDQTGVFTTLFEHSSSFSSVRVSKDGTRVALADITGGVHIIPLTSNAQRLEYRMGRKSPSENSAIVRFSVDGKMIAAGSSGGDTHVLDAATGTLVALLPGESEVTQLEFSRRGDRLLTVSIDGLARLWHVPVTPRALIKESRRLIPRCLDPAAREKLSLERTPPQWCVEMGKWPYLTP